MSADLPFTRSDAERMARMESELRAMRDTLAAIQEGQERVAAKLNTVEADVAELKSDIKVGKLGVRIAYAAGSFILGAAAFFGYGRLFGGN